MQIRDYVIRVFKLSYRFIIRKEFVIKACIINRQIANDLIYQLLIGDNACMISRFGTTELICINNYLCVHSNITYWKKIINYITDKTHTPWWFTDNFNSMQLNSGVFPPIQSTMEKFSERYLNDIPEIDLLGSFQYYEKFMPLGKNIKCVHLETLYPFFVEKPWTRALKGKKILVVHPFKETIEMQYKNRENLFKHVDILPEFSLITYKAIQSGGGTEVPFSSWFDALKYMEDDISKIDFDICLIGCGAYGLPLAAHVKRMGKKAVHVGGGLQLLFGIKGKRWETNGYFIGYNMPELFPSTYKDMFNQFWCKPLKQDTPDNFVKVDRASYW